MNRTSPLAILLMSPLALPAAAAEGAERDLQQEIRRVEEIRVYATPRGTSSDEVAQATTVLAGEQLNRALAPTLGETLGRQPGINTSYFGPAVGRPIIRGLGGPRVRVLEDGIVAADVSTTSSDHAVTVEPFLADQIEVLKGASTVLYGSGAIGGVVNTVTGRVPTELPDAPLSLRAQGSMGDVANEESGGVRLDGRAGNFAFHADGFVREAGLFDIPGFAESDAARAAEAAEHGEEAHEEHGEEGHEEGEEEAFGYLPNSDFDTEAFSSGFGWVGERARVGLAVSRFQTEYGLPGGHAHAHEEGEEHDDEHGDEHGDEHEEEGHEHGEEEGDVRIDLEQTRYDFRAALDGPFDVIETLRLRGAFVDYEHTEFEGPGVAGSRYENDTLEMRLEALNEPIAGFEGAFGIQYEDREFSSSGAEAFVIPVDRRTVALFAFQERKVGDLLLDVGARIEDVDYDPSAGRSADFTVGSILGGGLFAATEEIDLGFQVDLASRAPDIEELYSNGAHLATQTFEIGDATLDEEIAFNVAASLHAHYERFDLLLNVFNTSFSDFIYLQDTGAMDDGLPVRQWVQGDARLVGAEFELTVPLLRRLATLDLRLTGDTVRAELDDAPAGSNDALPRIPASRLGAAVDFSFGQLEGEIGVTRAFRQDEVATFETATDAFTDVNAHLGWHIDTDRTHVELYVRGRNLLNVEQRLHTSFLKDQAPLPGRALEAGVRVSL